MLSNKDILKKFIADFLLDDVREDEIDDKFNLLEAGLDSLGIMRLLDFLEKELQVDLQGVNINPAKVKSLDLILSLVDIHKGSSTSI
jgi:D-alanine--poly(phosphoribitol) ligase subunit 2